MSSDVLRVYQAHVQAALPVIQEPLPPLQEQILSYMMGGVSLTAAIKATGSKEITEASLVEDPVFLKYIEYFARKQMENVNFTRDDAHIMLLEAHRKSLSTTEEVLAITKMIDLHGLAAPKQQVNINLNENRNIDASEMSKISDDELYRLAGEDVIDLEPELIQYED